MYERKATAIIAMGRNTQFTTINLLELYSGLTKLDVFPGGGGIAGMITLESLIVNRLTSSTPIGASGHREDLVWRSRSRSDVQRSVLLGNDGF